MSQLSLGFQALYGHAQCTGNKPRESGTTWNPQKTTLFSRHYLRNRSHLDIDVLGYIGIV